MNDDEVVTIRELCTLMKFSRSTLHKYRRMGYAMEFGLRTTPGHFKLWLRRRCQEELDDLKKKIGLLQ